MIIEYGPSLITKYGLFGPEKTATKFTRVNRNIEEFHGRGRCNSCSKLLERYNLPKCHPVTYLYPRVMSTVCYWKYGPLKQLNKTYSKWWFSSSLTSLTFTVAGIPLHPQHWHPNFSRLLHPLSDLMKSMKSPLFSSCHMQFKYMDITWMGYI